VDPILEGRVGHRPADLIGAGIPPIGDRAPTAQRRHVGQHGMVMLIDLEPGDGRLERDAFPVLAELRTGLTAAVFAAVYDEGYTQGLRYLAAYDNGRCVGVAGWRVVATTAGTRKLYVDDLVTTGADRGRGVGALLLAELERRAAAAGCELLDLDSGVQRTDAHRFYLRERFEITGFHFAFRVPRTRTPGHDVEAPSANS
jgi:GNAT superfamily N-acetyltransferase